MEARLHNAGDISASDVYVVGIFPVQIFQVDERGPFRDPTAISYCPARGKVQRQLVYDDHSIDSTGEIVQASGSSQV